MEHFLKLQPGENPTEPQLVLSSTAALQGFLFVKQIYKAFSTAGSRDRAVILQNGMNEIKSRFYLVSLRGRPQGLPFLLSFEMKTRFPGITAILRIAIVPGTLTIPSLKNMASGITEAADALPDVRPSAE